MFSIVWCAASTQSLPDSVLTEQGFITIVRSYHPVAKQAELLVQKAQADLRASRGAFDPAFYISSSQKTFDGKNYYTYTNPELKIPTWYGIELKAGLENNKGSLLNSESTTGKTSYAGVQVPLAKNLLIDKRRAALQQARQAVSLSRAERLNLYNDLLFDAYAAYWSWVKEYQVYQLVTKSIELNEARYALIVKSYQQGDRRTIDTTLALSQLQNLQLQQLDALMRFRSAGFELSNYMWLPNQQPYTLPESIVPDSAFNAVTIDNYQLEPVTNYITVAMAQHPKLQSFTYKLNMLEIERQLKFQSLLPTLDVSANVLNKGYDVVKSADWNYLQQNNKFGVTFGMPLLLRQGRGDYTAAKIKIQETGLSRSQVQLQIENKVKDYYTETLLLKKQVAAATAKYKNDVQVFTAFEKLFRMGEAELFLVNQFENTAIASLQKLTELKTKFFKSVIALQWAGGQLR